MIFSSRRSNTFGSRKKLVTLISKSLARRSSSRSSLRRSCEIPRHIVGLDRCHRHAPLDPALQRTRLVKCKIVGRLGAQQINDFGQPMFCCILRHRTLRGGDGARCRLNSISASGIFATGRTRSTAPVMIALRGIPS